MQIIREIREIDSEELVIRIPREFRKKTVEVIILPINNKSENKISREAEDFLALGGSGCWEGNLSEMRESRDGIG
ncbi:MAG: hypothetical protein GY940_38240 [bacterium]|nr:hypothetical protein [bacterium]